MAGMTLTAAQTLAASIAQDDRWQHVHTVSGLRHDEYHVHLIDRASGRFVSIATPQDRPEWQRILAQQGEHNRAVAAREQESLTAIPTADAWRAAQPLTECPGCGRALT